MTVRYSEDVSHAKPFRLLKLLFRWRGSFYKLIVYEFAIYFLIYTLLIIIHSFVLNEEQEQWFSDFCSQLGRMSGYVVSSVIFCLGFFIQLVYRRFVYHFQVVPWPDGLAFLVSVNLRGKDSRGRLLRRTIVRYAVASIILTWMNFSERMKVLFPDLDCLVVAGFLTQHEVDLLKQKGIRPAWRQMFAVSWAAALIKRARMEGRIEDDHAYNAVFNELDKVRFRCRRLISQNNRPVPLAYLHVVIIAVYSFFSIAAVAGSHRLQTKELHKAVVEAGNQGELWMIRLFSELITLLQFSICAGVLAISYSLMMPFGMDDCDIDVEDIVRRHLSHCYLIVDEMHGLIPEMKDATTIFQSNETVFTSLFHMRGIRGLSKQSIDESIVDLHAPGYLLSVAPKKKAPEASGTSAAETVTTRFMRERSSSKLNRLLSFRKSNVHRRSHDVFDD